MVLLLPVHLQRWSRVCECYFTCIRLVLSQSGADDETRQDDTDEGIRVLRSRYGHLGFT